jgi:hypothetical protein
MIFYRENSTTLSWASLRSILQTEGEPVSSEDLDSFLVALLGANDAKVLQQQQQQQQQQQSMTIDAERFGSEILGFE